MLGLTLITSFIKAFTINGHLFLSSLFALLLMDSILGNAGVKSGIVKITEAIPRCKSIVELDLKGTVQ